MTGRRPTRILVVRHGQSTWNAEGRWQGQADPPLSALGEVQALHAATALECFDAIVASDLQRAALTASIIAGELEHGPVTLDQRLRERHAGPFQGLTREEVEERYPGFRDHGQLPPGFEPAHSAGGRALEALRVVAEQVEGGTALAVSHGGILRAIRKLLGVPGDHGFSNLSGQWFEFDGAFVVPGELVELLAEDRPAGSPVL